MRLIDMFYRLLDGDSATDPLLLDGQYEIPAHSHNRQERIMKTADQEIIAELFNDVYAKIAALTAHAEGTVTLDQVNTAISTAISEAQSADATFDAAKVAGYTPPAAAAAQVDPSGGTAQA